MKVMKAGNIQDKLHLLVLVLLFGSIYSCKTYRSVNSQLGYNFLSSDFRLVVSSDSMNKFSALKDYTFILDFSTTKFKLVKDNVWYIGVIKKLSGDSTFLGEGNLSILKGNEKLGNSTPLVCLISKGIEDSIFFELPQYRFQDYRFYDLNRKYYSEISKIFLSGYFVKKDGDHIMLLGKIKIWDVYFENGEIKESEKIMAPVTLEFVRQSYFLND